MALGKNNMEVELQDIRRDLNTLIKNRADDRKLLDSIKNFLVGDEDLHTTGIKQEFEHAMSWLERLDAALEKITGRIQHIFKWRDDYVAGKKEYKEWKTERFRWTFQNIWTVIATAFSVFIGLKQLGII